MKCSLAKVHVDVVATIEIDVQEARVLEHLTSYSLAEWFAKNCNAREVPEKKIKETLTVLRGQIAHIISVHDSAVKKVNKQPEV